MNKSVLPAPQMRFLTALILALIVGQASGQAPKTKHDEGLNEAKPRVFALVGAHIHVSPEVDIEQGIVLVRQNKIEGVIKDQSDIPADAQIVDMAGKHIYAGFTDAYVPIELDLNEKGTAYWNDNVRPQLSVATQLSLESLDRESFRKAGFSSALVVPENGIIKGTSSLVLLTDQDEEQALLNSEVAQHLRLTVSRRFGGGYPSSPMGAVALARQAMYDAQWYQQAHQVAKFDSKLELPETNSSLAALQPVINGDLPIMVDTSNELFVLRADRFAREFGLRLMLKGSGNEYRRLDEIVALGKPIVLPLNFPNPPDVSDPTAAMDVSLESLMHWDHAPENPGRLAKAGVALALTSDGLDDASELLEHLRIAVKRGLDEKSALASITTTPAELFGVDQQIGTITEGKLANLVVMDKPLFDQKSKVLETWVAGDRHEFERSPIRDVRGKWQFASEFPFLNGQQMTLKGTKSISATIGESVSDAESNNNAKDPAKDPNPKSDGQADDQAASKSDEKEDKEKSVKASKVNLAGARLSGMFNGTNLGADGMHRFSLLFVDKDSAEGQLISPDGAVTPLSVTKTGELDEEDLVENTKDPKNAKKKHKHDSKMASFPVNYPLGSYGRAKPPALANDVLINNVTIWTNTEAGVIENGAVLISDGKITGVFSGEDVLPTVQSVVDGSGMHLTPGIIDCHSHMATDSGVNEGAQAVTAEVRIGDLIDCDDINIYRQLAGGVTCVSVLHGSANPIGGQNQVIKLRWGALDEAMKFTEAPAGIKFALGENVKRSRSPESTRYPKTRMGVEQILRDRFRAAEEYLAAHERFQADRKGLPPRVDLELQCLGEIVTGDRWIHCHSYRQDEILALIRVLDDHGITIGTFQHILEGYKVADAMAKHGAMASAFADWWAYKMEVYDAIPYAGALMHKAGVVVSYNSDDAELARHLNHEAAKAVKYGGVPETEALKFVTLNPARQLRIDQYVGSIEVGKHADLALWSGPPLSPTSRCQQTWVDGRKYFDFEKAMFDAEAFFSMRNTLVQKILSSGQEMKTPSMKDIDPARLWPRYDEFCHDHDHEDDH